ncbi:MAG: hypothetical protein HRU25_11235 [Psychrobium sp.]|nr:hypothetical protein [Psychrobium sp.]
MQYSTLNKQIVIRRLSQFALAMMLVAGLGVLLWQSNEQSQQMRQQQETAIAGILKQQLALAATMGLKFNEQQQLQWLAQTLTKSPLINGIWIHRADGTLMAESAEHNDGESVILAVEIRQEKLLGYLRLRLNKDVFVQPIIEIQQQQLESQRWSLLIAAIIGILLTRSFSQKRARYQLRNLLWLTRKKERQSRPNKDEVEVET